MRVKNNKFKRYKALMLDVDGTLVSVKENSMPSQKVVTVLKKASKFVSIHLITARPFTDTHNLPNIFRVLPFLSESIINGGAQIINPQNHKITSTIAMRKLSSSHTKILLNYCSEIVAITPKNKSFPLQQIPISEQIIKIVAVGVENRHMPVIMNQLLALDDIAVYQTTSYKNGSDIIITHKNATKEKAVKLLMKKHNLLQEEIIGVGDTTHDLPFLQQCGMKVAMGNAQQELKNIADFVAPSVSEDGLVAVIERFL